MRSDMSLLSVQDLCVQFHDGEKGREAVSCLSFEVQKGEVLGVVGESGSGKSTAMKAIVGLLPEHAEVSAGRIMIGDEDITPPDLTCGGRLAKRRQRDYERKLEGIRGSRISIVFQDPLSYLNPSVKIGRQIAETIRAHRRCSRREAKEEAVRLLELAGVRESRLRMKQYPFELSGGMRQRVVLAIALACEPELLIADEPTTALDVTVQRQILALFKRIAEEMHTAVILVSHDLGVIAALSRRILVMKDGGCVEEGAAEKIFYEPEHPYTKELLDYASKLHKTARGGGTGEALLTVSGLGKSYGEARISRQEAVRELNLEIGRGETYGLVGESGCGKSTLARLITRLQRPDTGEINYYGERGIQMVFQDSYASLNPRMRVGEALEEPLLLNTDDTGEARRQKVREILSLTGLEPEAVNKYPRAFSGGQCQRICIARALIAEPELVVCDEPVTGLDVSIQEQIMELLEQIQRERKVSYLFISHDLNVVKRISQRVGIMYGGSMAESGDTEQVYCDPWHPYTKELLAAVLFPDPRKARRKKESRYIQEEKQEIQGRGCPYAPRCGYAMECCSRERPGTYQFGTRSVSCFLYSWEHTGRRSSGYKMTSQI